MVTYVDASVLLAAVLVEDRTPSAQFWQSSLVSSRLLQYEVWVRINARKLAESHGDTARAFLGRVDLLELSPPALARALDPYPLVLRTLDALHLASIEYMRAQGSQVQLASYDRRLRHAAQRLKIPLYRL